MNLFKFLTKKRPTSQGFHPKKAPNKPQLQAFILEQILTPSGLFDGGDDGSDTLILDLDTHPLPDVDPVDISHDASDSLPDDTGIHTLSHVDLSDPISLDSIPVQYLEPVSFIYPDTLVDDFSETDLTHPLDTVHFDSSEPLAGDVETHPVAEDLGVHTLDETIPGHNNQSIDSITPDDHATIEVETLVSGTELTTDPPTFTFDSGVFTVGETGEVSVDYLFDGGRYQGELAIFSLDGMEHLEPGSHEFIQEAAHRALSDSPLGHVVISDRIEGARFSGILPHEQDWNVGDYQGVKTVEMNPGDEFGIMLVPNSTVQKLFNNPDAGGAVRPLFSMATANPNDAFHVGQIADVTGDGTTFVMEDLRVDRGSDHDYNDIIFQVRGATGTAVNLDEVIDPAKDWRSSDLGQALIDYATPPEPVDSQPPLPEFPVVDQPLIGVIDTGFSGNNPDIDYSRLMLGSDRIDHDTNPLLTTGEGSEHGTHILGIIGAAQNNDIGIDGINDDAPIWVSRATGSGQWADSLVEFVDAAKASAQPNAVVNLSLDLTQINPDGSVTTRYEFTPHERAAIEYARQNDVLIVVAAGNDGDVMSVLGQASQEFDNIITVGAAQPIEASANSSHLTLNVPSDSPTTSGFERAAYSSYGYGLDIMASGGTVENPVLSTVGDGLGTMAGTSVAVAKVTGAASQVWAANPQLSYRQVIDILKSTATDLNTRGWDIETGAGLLNLAGAVELARVTMPIPYDPPNFLIPTTWDGEGKVIPTERAASSIGEGSRAPHLFQEAFNHVYNPVYDPTPVGNAYRWGNGWTQEFRERNGNTMLLMLEDGADRAYSMWGGNLEEYKFMGGAVGTILDGRFVGLGYPRSFEIHVPRSDGQWSVWQGFAADDGKARIHHVGGKSVATWGDIGRLYTDLGGIYHWLGYPTRREYFDGDTIFSDFEGGRIAWRNGRTEVLRYGEAPSWRRSNSSIIESITPNYTISRSLSSSDPQNPLRSGKFYDDYQLTGASPGQQIQVNLNSSDFDAYLQLVNASTGQLIDFNDDGGGGRNSLLSFTVQSGVNYLIRVTSFGDGAIGNYTLTTSTTSSTTSTTTSTTSPTIPANHWRAEYFNNRGLSGNPVYIQDLGDGSQNLERQWGMGSPSSAIPSDNFSARITTQRYFPEGKYQIKVNGDDGVRVRIGNQTVIDKWQDQGFENLHTGYFYSNGGQYPVTVEYYENGGNAALKLDIQSFNSFDELAPNGSQWNSSFFWWDRGQGNTPPTRFYENRNNLIGVVSLGSNQRSDKQSGINWNWGTGSPKGDSRFPSDFFAVRSYTDAYFEKGKTYRIRVSADDGFQLFAKHHWLPDNDPNKWVYITPREQWQSAYGAYKDIDFTVPNDGMYDLHFHLYEEGGDAYINLLWGELVGNFAVSGIFFDAYKNRRELGNPTGDVFDTGNGTFKQNFEYGYIFWNGRETEVYQSGRGTPSQLSPSSEPTPQRLRIELSYPNGDFTESQKRLIQKAADNWQRIITKDKVPSGDDRSGLLRIALTKNPSRLDGGSWWVSEGRFTAWAEAYTDNVEPNFRRDFQRYGKDNEISFNRNIVNGLTSSQLLRLTMHEIGHTLGLDHEDGDSNSLMNATKLAPHITDNMYRELERLGYSIDRNARIDW